jgi:hypothetical protein
VERDLDEPGLPMKAWYQHEDGTRMPFLIEQSKRNNFQDLCTIMGGEDKVTREAVEAAGYDWRDWAEFVLEMLDHQRDTQDIMASEVARIEAATGGKVEPPKLEKDRLGLLHLKDPPEQTSPPSGGPPGREPPADTGWG